MTQTKLKHYQSMQASSWKIALKRCIYTNRSEITGYSELDKLIIEYRTLFTTFLPHKNHLVSKLPSLLKVNFKT